MLKFKIKDHQIGKDIWMSKTDLFHNFYGEFYNFILNNGGQEDLESHNIHNVNDF